MPVVKKLDNIVVCTLTKSVMWQTELLPPWLSGARKVEFFCCWKMRKGQINSAYTYDTQDNTEGIAYDNRFSAEGNKECHHPAAQSKEH